MQQPLIRAQQAGERLSNDPWQFYPGQTYAGANPFETQAFRGQMGYQQGVFGEGGSYGDLTGANQQMLGGGANAQMFGGMAPLAMGNMMQQFGGGPQVNIGQWGQGGFSPQAANLQFQAPDATQPFGQVGYNPNQFAPDVSGRFGEVDYDPNQFAPDVTGFYSDVPFDPSAFAPDAAGNFSPINFDPGQFDPQSAGGFSPVNLDPGRFTPGVPQTVNQDPNQAIGRMLSGDQDFGGLGAATRAAIEPMMTSFTKDLMPELQARSNQLYNPTGGIKMAGRAMENITDKAGDIAAQMAWQERQRAMGQMGQGAQLATQAGLQQQGQGLQAYGLGAGVAGQQAGLDRGLQQAQAQARQADVGLGLQGAGQLAGLNQAQQAQLGQLQMQGYGLGLQGAGTQANLMRDLQSQMAGGTLQGYGMGLQGAGAQAGLQRDLQSQLAGTQLQGYGMGLQGAGAQAGLQRGLQQDISGAMLGGAGLGLSGAQSQLGVDWQRQALLGNLGMQGQQLGMQGDVQRQAAFDQYRQQAMGMFGQTSGMGAGINQAQQQGIGNWGGVYGMGMDPFNTMGQFGQFQRGFDQQQAQENQQRFMFNQAAPYDAWQRYVNPLMGMGGLGGTMTQTTPMQSNPMMGAAGGAMAGMQYGPWGAAAGGVLGGLGGLGGK